MLRLHMQVWQPGTEQKTRIKYFLVVKLAQYLICEEDRKPTSYCKHEILSLSNLEICFRNSKVSFLVVKKTDKCKRGCKTQIIKKALATTKSQKT